MANTIKALYRNDTGSLATYYKSFNAYNLLSIWSSEYASTGINIMGSIDGQHQIIKKGERFIADGDYIACGQASSGSIGLLFILTDSSATQVINYVFKTRTELGNNYNTYRNAFRLAMTDQIRNEVKNLFSISLTVTTSGNEILISDGGQSIIINSTTHAIKYGTNGLWTNDTAVEYTTLQTNGWLIDGTYTYGLATQEYNTWENTINSIKQKSQIILTITTTQESGYILISDGNNGLEIKSNPTTIRFHEDYYDESSDINTEYNILQTNGRLTSGTYEYASVHQQTTDWYNIISSIKTKGIANATITHDTTNGEITMTNGQWSFTVADKNLGAITVWNDGDTLSETNCGKYYEWGNNYGFAWSGGWTTTNTQVDASLYGPGNYYSSSNLFIGTQLQYDWSNVKNDNLRGDSTDTEAARQGPCPSGYHVPSKQEWLNFIQMFSIIRPNDNIIDNLRNTFHMPLAGQIHTINITPTGQGSEGWYWTSSPAFEGSDRAFGTNFKASYREDRSLNRKSGISIRPFKNTVTS